MSSWSDSDTMDTICWSMIGVGVAIACYGLYQMAKYRHYMFVSKRSWIVVYGLNGAFILAVISMQTARTMLFEERWRHRRHVSVVPFFMAAILWHCIFCIYNANLCTIFFRERWTFFTLQSEWEKLLARDCTGDESDAAAQNGVGGQPQPNWFLHHHHKYGNIRYLLKRFAVFHGIASLLCIADLFLDLLYFYPNDAALEVHVNETIEIFTTWLPFIGSSVFLVVMVIQNLRVKLSDDTFHIHWELKLIARILLVVVVSATLESLVQTLAFGNQNRVVHLLVTTALNLLVLSVVYISTFGVLYKCKPWELPILQAQNCRWIDLAPAITANKFEVSANSELSPRGGHDSNFDLVPGWRRPRVSLAEVLDNYVAIHLFMTYLATEYSMEVLLSYIELWQFAVYIKQYLDKEDEIGSPPVSDQIPMSGIIKHAIRGKSQTASNDSSVVSEGFLVVNRIACEFSQKYLASGAEFELNLSHDLRLQCEALSHDLRLQCEAPNSTQIAEDKHANILETWNLTQQLLSEMFVLLFASLSRFKDCPNFCKVNEMFITDSSP